MTFSIDGTEIVPIVEVASIVGTVIGALLIALVVYLLIRPPRHIRQGRKAERRGEVPRDEREDPDAEALWQLADRMEARLEVLERALGDQLDRPAVGRRRERELDQLLSPAEDGRDS
jgi:hypothetical protein